MANNTLESFPLTERERACWLDRWNNCFPYTYPPEIYALDGTCKLCGEKCETGHLCKELRNG